LRPSLHQPSAGVPTETPAAASADLPQLTQRMRGGEEAAYREFYDAYYDRLFRYLLVVAAGDLEAAEEALEATLLRVVRYIKVFAAEDVFWSWLTVLARSSFSDRSRKQRRYFAFLDRFRRHQIIAGPDPGSSAADARLLAALERSLAALPEDERQLLESKYFAHRAVRDIAAELETSEKAIESRLVRIRRKLKDALMEDLKNG
jgi:RNA polymerase sigma-70 factor (ECF subfamily)